MRIPEEVEVALEAGYMQWVVEAALDELSLEGVLGQCPSLWEGTQDKEQSQADVFLSHWPQMLDEEHLVGDV